MMKRSTTVTGHQVNDTDEKIRANQQTLTSALRSQYDFIICGAGAAGSVIAGQLAANPDVHVLLLEAGGTDNVEAVLDPNQWLSTLGSELDWGFHTEQNPHLNGRSLLYSMGKALGGGGSINVGVWSRGHKADWDYFADASGDPAWNYKSVLEIYKHIENRAAGSESVQPKASGQMWIQPAQNPHPFYAAALDSMSAQGMRRFDKLSGELWEEPSGCAYVDEFIRDGRRQSPFRSYVYPRMQQPNLTVLTGATVSRVRFQNRQAVGVEFTHEDKDRYVAARLEIVLSLGALQTPKVLMQSGVGDEQKLKPFGIPVIQHLPGVAKNMHDHISFGCVWEASEVDMPTAPRGQAVGFWKTDPGMDVPNALAFAIPITYATPENGQAFELPTNGWSLFAGLATAGRGELFLTGPTASDPLQVKTDFLSESKDLETALEVIAMCRRIGNGKALRPYAKREAVPGELATEAMEQFVRNGVSTFWHQSGSAAMGRDQMAVVNSKLQVYGVERLRVADASIMPRVTVGNTMAPCVVIGQRAADMITGNYGN